MDGETSKDHKTGEQQPVNCNNYPWAISLISVIFAIFSFTWKVTHEPVITCTVIENGTKWQLSGGIKSNHMLTIEEMAKLHSVDKVTIEAWVNSDMIHPHPVKYRQEKTLYLFEPEHTVKMK